MTLAENRKKSRWRRFVIGGIASLLLAGGVALMATSGRHTSTSGASSDATGLDATGIGYRYGTFDATAIRSW
jgi:hypothetical protein